MTGMVLYLAVLLRKTQGNSSPYKDLLHKAVTNEIQRGKVHLRSKVRCKKTFQIQFYRKSGEQKQKKQLRKIIFKKKFTQSSCFSPLNTTPTIGSGFPSFFLGIPFADSTMTRSILTSFFVLFFSSLFFKDDAYPAERERSYRDLRAADVREKRSGYRGAVS